MAIPDRAAEVDLPLVRTRWIALAVSGPVLGLGGTLDDGALRVVRDGAVFGSILCGQRPRIAVISSPPATERDLALAVTERRRRSSLRIVHLSPAPAVDERIHALGLGFDEALADDIDAGELLARLRMLDVQTEGRRDGVLPVAADVVLDPIAHEVRRDGRVVHLRPKEYQLLAMLAAHPGRAYTRRQLLERVWGHDHHGDPRTIDVHVRWLRSKIEPRPDAPVHLVTVRGVGYRLDPSSR